MKKFSFNKKIKGWPALYFGLAICLLSMVCIGCGDDGDDDDFVSTPASTPYALEYAHLMYRNYESGDNRYQGVMGITYNGGPIQETDIIDVGVTDSSGSDVIPDAYGFYHDTFMLLDCMSGACSQSGPFEDTGRWGRIRMLAADTYDIEIDMENGQTLSTSCDYQGIFELPYVSDMLSDWNDGDLVLSWDNPDTDPAWSEVDQVRINVFDNNDNVVLRVKTVPSETTVTIPANLVSQAATLLGGDSLALWEIQTRAYDANNMNFARGYSYIRSIRSPPPTNGITPGKWSGIAEFGSIEFEVTSDGTGISTFSYDWENYTCGSITKNGSGTRTWTPALSIVNNQINFELSFYYGPLDTEYLTIDGIFETSGDYISGNFEYDNPTAICSGTWSALPVGIADQSDDDGDGYSENDGDCNDDDASIHPGATDICGDGIDQDCIGGDETCDAFLEVFNDFHITQRIYLDNLYIGDVRPGQTVTFNISAGFHTVKFCDDIYGCVNESFNAVIGNTYRFTVS